tara:strand:- start:281 stop:625 length:345 start_codon:yes stop_codon:yes gene_type:complete
MNSNLIYGILYFLIGHILAWFQLNGQFKWPWFQSHEWVIALFGVPMSFLYIWGTKYTVLGMSGLLWPTRFIGFGIGIIVYAILVGYFFNEGLTLKTYVSLTLAVGLICVQVLWK